MNTIKKTLALLMAAAMIFAMAACSNGSSGNNSNSKGTLILGTSADYAPFEFHTMINGTDTIVGSDIDMAKHICEELGYDMEIKDISFDVLLNELQNGTIDFVMAGMAVNDERLQQADASDIYYDATYQTLVIRKEDADKYKTFDDFSGVKVGVQTGTIQIGMAQENLTGCEIVQLQAVPDIFNNLINGKLEAALVDGNVGDGYIASNEELAAVPVDFPTEEGMSVWVKKGDPKGLLGDINKIIAAVKESGQYKTWLEEAEKLSEE